MLVSRANFMASFVVHFECFIAKALIASFNKCLLTNLNALLPESSSVNENLKKKPVPSMSINKLDWTIWRKMEREKTASRAQNRCAPSRIPSSLNWSLIVAHPTYWLIVIDSPPALRGTEVYLQSIFRSDFIDLFKYLVIFAIALKCIACHRMRIPWMSVIRCATWLAGASAGSFKMTSFCHANKNNSKIASEFLNIY